MYDERIRAHQPQMYAWERQMADGVTVADLNETTIEEMAKLLPTHLVIRDASAANDNVLDNFDQIIKSYSNGKKITTHIL